MTAMTRANSPAPIKSPVRMPTGAGAIAISDTGRSSANRDNRP